MAELSAQQITLNKALVEGDFAAVSSMLYNGHPVNTVDQFGNYPICVAVYYENAEILEELIRYGANINQRDKMNNTPIIIAAAKNYYKHVEILLQNGANPNDVGANGYTALMFACSAKDVWDYRVIELLIMNGADINMQNDFYQTALDIAANEEIKQILIQYGGVSATDLTDLQKY
jgi:ankyrin repeat protein